MAKTVPLVVYLEDGTRKVIGTADVEDDGTIKGQVTDTEFSRRFESSSDLYSVSMDTSFRGEPEAAVAKPSPIQKMDLGDQSFVADLPKLIKHYSFPEEKNVHTEGT